MGLNDRYRTQSRPRNTQFCQSVARTGAIMIRLPVVLAFVFISGCSTWGGASGQATNLYKYAANSWIGAQIEQMVAAWGTPNRGYYPAKGEEQGVAGWGIWSQTGIGDNKEYRYRCETLAYFDAEGIITRIVVKHALSCDRPYEGQLERMTCLNNAPIST